MSYEGEAGEPGAARDGGGLVVAREMQDGEEAYGQQD
jgi:hypothetical protein